MKKFFGMMLAGAVGLFAIPSDAQTRTVVWSVVSVTEYVTDLNKETVIPSPIWMKDYICTAGSVSDSSRFLSCARSSDVYRTLIGCGAARNRPSTYYPGTLVFERKTVKGLRTIMILNGCMIMP